MYDNKLAQHDGTYNSSLIQPLPCQELDYKEEYERLLKINSQCENTKKELMTKIEDLEKALVILALKLK